MAVGSGVGVSTAGAGAALSAAGCTPVFSAAVLGCEFWFEAASATLVADAAFWSTCTASATAVAVKVGANDRVGMAGEAEGFSPHPIAR